VPIPSLSRSQVELWEAGYRFPGRFISRMVGCQIFEITERFTHQPCPSDLTPLSLERRS